MKAMLFQLKQIEEARQGLLGQLEDEKKQRGALLTGRQKEEEVMFSCIHNVGTGRGRNGQLGKSALMYYYLTCMDNYKPKGWIARVRASQAKTF